MRMTPRLGSLFLLCIPAAAAAPRSFAIDGNRSTASAHLGKTGIGSFAGHEHVIVAHSIQGEVALDTDQLSRSSVDLVINTRSLRVAEANEPAGDPPQIQQTMRGPKVLDVARFGAIHVSSQAVTGKLVSPEKYQLSVICELSLHGISKSFTLPVELELHGDTVTATGKLVLKQTDFGIEPTSAAGGLVRVEDEVPLVFRIVARAAAQ